MTKQEFFNLEIKTNGQKLYEFTKKTHNCSSFYLSQR